MWYYDLPTLLGWLAVICAIIGGAFYLYLLWPLYVQRHYTFLAGPSPRILTGTLAEEHVKGILKVDLERQKMYGPIFMTWLGRQPVINVADPVVVREIMAADFSNFANKSVDVPIQKIKQESLIFLEDDHWKYVRTVLTPHFSSGKLRQMVPLVQERVERLMACCRKAEASDQPLDVFSAYGALTMDVILATAFGVDVDSQKDPDDPFVKNARAVFQGLTKGSWGLKFYVLVPLLRPFLRFLGCANLPSDPNGFFDGALKSILQERKKDTANKYSDLLQMMIKTQTEEVRATKSDDAPPAESGFLDRMANHRKAKGLTDSEIIAQSLTFLLAGHETTATLLTYLSHCLAANPDIQSKVIEEVDSKLDGTVPTHDNTQQLSYLDMCISECLRMFPPVVRIIRKPKHERMIKGVRFPADSKVAVLVYAIHRNPDLWPNPDKYDPERFSPENKQKIRPYSYLPFSSGPRNCIGMRFAMMEAKMALAAIFQSFRFNLTSNEPLKPHGASSLLGQVPVNLRLSKR